MQSKSETNPAAFQKDLEGGLVSKKLKRSNFDNSTENAKGSTD